MGFNDSRGVYHAFHKTIPLSLFDFRLATTGDVGDTTANGGLFSSNTAPALSGTGSTVSQQLNWATGSAVAILAQIALPEDFSDEDDVYVDLWVASGTTNAATIGVVTSWNGGTGVSDSADDAATLSATAHKITARIAAADIPAGAERVSLELTPPTHATDAIQLFAARIRYVPRVTS